MSYPLLKKLLRSAIPRTMLYRLEPALRLLHSLPFRGYAYNCNICGTGLNQFLNQGGEQICPRCGSLGRNRRLWSLLENEFLASAPKILDFSPSRSLYRKLKKSGLDYTASDISGDFVADLQWNLVDLPAPDGAYDLVICYHVLEHIPEDRRAMSELYRVTKSGGHCLIQTPFREGEIYEDPSITSSQARKIHFGQGDHVRIYSAERLNDRLKEAGFSVEIRTFREEKNNSGGLGVYERVLICSK